VTILDLVLLIIGMAFGVGGTAWITARFDLRGRNFRGDHIPKSAGLAFVLCGAFVYGVSWFADGAPLGTKAAFLLVLLTFGILGFWDDVRGDRSVGGFKGHLRALFSGKVTTGAIKLIGGTVVSLIAAGILWYPYIGHCVVAFFLIPLAANTLNLLDLRPGRSLFGFFLLATIVIVSLALQGQLGVGYFVFIAIAVAALLYPLDAFGQIMLGDTGSNAFGAVIGVSLALYLPIWDQLILLAALAGFNMWCERNSFSKTVENNRFLRAVDRKIGIR